MFRNLTLVAALFASSAAVAGDAEITLKFATDVAGALDIAQPEAGWTAVLSATMATTGGSTDIRIDASGSAAGDLVVSVNPQLLSASPWGRSADGQFSIYAVDSIAFGPGAKSGWLDALAVDGAAQIAAPRGLSWNQVASEHVGYVVVDNLTYEAVTTIPIIFH